MYKYNKGDSMHTNTCTPVPGQEKLKKMAFSGLTKSKTKDIIIFQLLEDIENMEENDVPSQLFDDASQATIEATMEKLKTLFGIEKDFDLEAEYELIQNKTSKLPASKRTVIKYIVTANSKMPRIDDPEVVEDGKVPDGEVIEAELAEASNS